MVVRFETTRGPRQAGEGLRHQHRSTRTITTLPSQVSSYSWSPSGDAIAYLATDAVPDADPLSPIKIIAIPGCIGSLCPAGHRKTFDKSGSPYRLVRNISGCKTCRVCCPAHTAQSRCFHCRLYQLDLRRARRSLDRSTRPRFGSILFPRRSLDLFPFTSGLAELLRGSSRRDYSSGAAPFVISSAKQNFDVFRNGNVFAWSPDSTKLIYTAGQGVQDILVSPMFSIG